jgi:hypothetical protein
MSGAGKMEIAIGGYAAASLRLEREPKDWHALVLLDSDKRATDFVANHSCSHRYLRFDDIEDARPGKLLPTRS